MSAFNFLWYIQCRYPCSTKNVQGFQIPEYDGLCLDINSIVIANIYSNKKSFSNENIFGNITEHIDFLFRSVKSTKFIFMAFDGVLPDAKLNYLKNKVLAIKSNILNVYKENKFLNTSQDEFDISYFAAGTTFIKELFSYLKHFVAYKISTDSKWQKHKILINGPEIPGESKIKIAQFIRYYKAQNKSQITKYCLYTFDSELLLLGLSTHEPYITIIQDRRSHLKIKNSITPEETDFLLTHLSLIREYLEHEFNLSLKGKLKFEYDFEKMLDDWILIGLLISTYSLPYFSHLNVETGALSLVLKTYLKTLPSLDGYINEFGELIVKRLQKFMKKLSKIEIEILESKDCEILDQEKIKHKLKSINIDKVFSKSDKRKGKQKTELPAISAKIRNDYYKKFESQNNIDFERFVPAVVSEYIKSIQWNLKYYYQECCSWSWTYSYSEAPLICDMLNLNEIDLSFEIGKPLGIPKFLLLVLPSSNIQNILTDKETDKTMKVCLFVYSESKANSLTEQHGFTSFVSHADLRFIKIEDLTTSRKAVLKKPIITLDNNTLGFPTFSHILYKLHLELKKKGEVFLLDNHGCDDSNSTNEVAILNVTSHVSSSFQEIAAKVLGKSLFVNWPYLKDAYVYSITDFKNEIALKKLFRIYEESNIIHKKLSENKIKTLREASLKLKIMYGSIGICIGTTKLLVGVYLKIGDRYTYEPRDKMKLRPMYNFKTTFVPFQLLPKSAHESMTFIHYKFVHNVFSISNLCFMIGHPHYGSLGVISSISRDNKISVRLNAVHESKDYFEALFKTNNLYNFELLKYLDINSVAEILDLKPFVLHTICQSIYVVEKTIDNDVVKQIKHNIGLRLIEPTNSQEQTLAYTIKRDSLWLFSSMAIELIRNYMLEFPEIIEMVDKKTNTKEYDASECFKNASVLLQSVDKWLRKSRKIVNTVQKDILKLILDNVNALDEIVSKNKSTIEEIDVDVSPEILFKPGTTSGLAAPDERARHDLLDRIINIRENFTVPFGLKGIIINIISSNISKWHNIYEVIFDSPFPGGLKLYGSSECKYYRLTVADFINVSYGERNKENYIDDSNKEKVKMKKFIKHVNENTKKRKDKRLAQIKEKKKVQKFASKCKKLGFSTN